jgi:hypothetical protein
MPPGRRTAALAHFFEADDSLGLSPGHKMRTHISNLPGKGTFTSFFKDKKPLRSRKTVVIKVFLTIFAW